jgi:hypothetical protein
MAKLVKAQNLKPGMEIDIWDRANGDESTVVSAEVYDRPGFRWKGVRITFKSGPRINSLEGSKFNVK